MVIELTAIDEGPATVYLVDEPPITVTLIDPVRAHLAGAPVVRLILPGTPRITCDTPTHDTARGQCGCSIFAGQGPHLS